MDVGVERELDCAAIQFTWVRIRPLLWSNNGGVQRQRRSALGARRLPHHLSRMLAGLCWDARRSKKHNITPCSEASPPHHPAPCSHGAAITASPGTRLERLQGAASRLLKLICSPFPRLQQWSAARESGSRGASPGLAPAAAQSAPRTRPPSVNPAPSSPLPALRANAGSRRPEARLPSAGPAQ